MCRNILLTIPDKDCLPLHLGSGPVTGTVVAGHVLRAVLKAPLLLFGLKRKVVVDTRY